MKKPTSQTIEMDLNQMEPFPLQPAFFSACTAGEDEALEQDLRQNGQRDPIVLLPANPKRRRKKPQILDGHRRRVLLLKLGRKTAKVMFREDLADADDGAVEAVFLQYNFVRRQLSMLEKASIGLRLMELQKKKPRGGIKPGSHDEREARDRVGKLLGMSGRHLDRLFRILLTPVEIRRAVEAGHLPLVLAERVEGLARDEQTSLVKRIAVVTDASEISKVVAEAIATSLRQSRSANAVLSQLVRHLNRAVPDLEQRLNQVAPNYVRRLSLSLNRTREFIGRLMVYAGEAGPEV